MKRTLLFIACVLASLTMLAQEYYPEGTKWTEIRLDTLKYDSWYSKVGDEWVPNFETIEYYVKGEYIDKFRGEGKDKYRCVYTNGPEWRDSLTLLLQESGDVEYIEPNSVMVSVPAPAHYYDWNEDLTNGPLCSGVPVYQFNWSIGKGIYFRDITMSMAPTIPIYYGYYGIIDEIKEGYFGGVSPLKYVNLDGKAPECGKWDNPQNVDSQGGRIIHGIGITEWNDGECLFGAPRPYDALYGYKPNRHYRSMLVHFERNGEVLYDVWPDVSSQINQGDFDYIPFVKDGKQWHVVRSEYGSGNHFDQFLLLNEKVVKDGKTYMKMYRSKDNATTVYDAGLLREEERKVYFFDNDMQKEYLIFDYSLKAGDTYETYSLDEQKIVSYKVISVGDYREGPDIVRYGYNQAADSMETNHRYLRQWTVRRTDNGLEKTWIEGVGSLEGPLKNLQDIVLPDLCKDYLAYVENNSDGLYLPFSFYDTMNKQIHGCNLPKTASYIPEDWHSQLTYELEDNRLHVYGQLVLNCGCYNYVYFTEELTDNPLVHKLHFEIQNVGEEATCVSLFATDFYVPGFDPNLNYIIVDNQGEEHPVINKTPQMAYRPFVEDGKVWKVGAVNSGNPAQWVEYYYFDGDTIIDGKTCKQMMCQRYVNPDFAESNYISQDNALSYVGAWYEEDQKVYAYKDHQFKLMYDFSANAYDTLLIDNGPYVIGPKQTGGIRGFKGVYRAVFPCSGVDSNRSDFWFARWLEGVGSIDGPMTNIIDGQLADPAWFLMSCTVGDEVIYLNDAFEDGATPETSNAPKSRFDFTHIIKTRPKAPKRRGADQSIYGEYNEHQLGINLDPLDEAYLVRITDDKSGKVVYEKAINAGNIVALNIDISTYAKGHYTITVENSLESFTGEFDTIVTGIVEVRNKKIEVRDGIYNLQGQSISYLQKGLNIVNGRKVMVK